MREEKEMENEKTLFMILIDLSESLFISLAEECVCTADLHLVEAAIEELLNVRALECYCLKVTLVVVVEEGQCLPSI